MVYTIKDKYIKAKINKYTFMYINVKRKAIPVIGRGGP
jgi:hypothetical protein